METNISPDEDLARNYLDLKEILETGLANAGRAATPYEAKGFLIEVQNHFRGLKLRREDREELYNRLQEAFSTINKKIEQERTDFEQATLANFHALKPEVEKASEMAISAEDTREAWNFLLTVQNRIKGEKLTREQRDKLTGDLQVAFDMIKLRREETQQQFDREASLNYSRLKTLVEQGLEQAEASHEYKETREFLKKIQSEFKGVKMAHEQREELYSRLQTAFDILSKRLDDFFRHKKKNWEVKMQFTLSRFSADIFELRETVAKEDAELEELMDQLDIMISSGRDRDSRAALEARIASARRSLEQKRSHILTLEMDRDSLKNKLEEGETEG